MTLIYLMMGEILDIPLYGVLMPGHIYVRYKEEGRAGVNVETTMSGMEIYHYARHFGLSIANEDGSIYGKELNKYQVLGAYLNNLGNYYLVFGETEKAKILFKKSIGILPALPESYANLGMARYYEKDFEGAASVFEKGISRNPERPGLHILAAEAFLAAKLPGKAKTHAREAYRLSGKTSRAAKKLLEKIRMSDHGK